jgi:protein unc-79
MVRPPQDHGPRSCCSTTGRPSMLICLTGKDCFASFQVSSLQPTYIVCWNLHFPDDLVPFVCQRDQCPNAGNAEAAKVCYEHCISIMYATDSPPPLYLCIECANEIHREHPDLLFGDILHPMQQVSMICENKNCRSTDKSAISICFSNECASYNGNHPIRYCAQCHGNRHNSRRGVDHIVHRSLPPAW